MANMKRIYSKHVRPKNFFQVTGVFSFLVITTYIIDTRFRVHYAAYSDALRLVDHLIAGVCIPLILFLLFGKMYTWSLFYLVCCTNWEISQFVQRDYFQFNQYACDLLGIGLAVYLYRQKKLKRDA